MRTIYDKNCRSRSNRITVFVALVALLLISCSYENDEMGTVAAVNPTVSEPIRPTPTFTPSKKSKKKKGKMDTKLKALPVSVWGGEGIIVNVNTNDVTIQYECADGKIEQPLLPTPDGVFNSNGLHTRQRSGPMRSNQSQAVKYEGKIAGDVMSLKVMLAETNEVIGEYTLERGKIIRLARCY